MTRVQANRRRLLLATTTFAAVLVLSVLVTASGRGAGSPPGTGPLPLLGTADPAMSLMGAAPAGQPGEAWGYRQLPLAVGSAEVGSRSIPFGPPLEASNPRPQLAFLRYTDASGWQVYDTPVDASGNPYRGPSPNRLSARITREGGGVLVGRDSTRPTSEQVVVLDHDPGGAWKAAESAAADGAVSGRRRKAGGGPGRRTRRRADRQTRPSTKAVTPASSLPRSAARQPTASSTSTAPNGVARKSKSRPARKASSTSWRSTPPVSATPGRLPKPADGPWVAPSCCCSAPRRPEGPLWVEHGLGAARFADRETPALGIAGLEPIGGAAQPLTVTSDGVWIDLTGTIGGIGQDITIYYGIGAGAVTGSWCDVSSVCDKPLGVKLSRQIGYRSFAWPGAGFGSRIVTNPLDAGGGEESNRGTYLRLSGEEFVRMPGGGGNFRAGGAFYSDESGWLDGPVEISGKGRPRSPAPVARLAAGAADRGDHRSGLDAGLARLPGAGGRGRRRGGPLHPRPGLAPRVPAQLQRRGEEADPARRRLARTRGTPTRSATSGRCGSGTPTTTSGSPTPGSRSASKAT